MLTWRCGPRRGRVSAALGDDSRVVLADQGGVLHLAASVSWHYPGCPIGTQSWQFACVSSSAKGGDMTHAKQCCEWSCCLPWEQEATRQRLLTRKGRLTHPRLLLLLLLWVLLVQTLAATKPAWRAGSLWW